MNILLTGGRRQEGFDKGNLRRQLKPWWSPRLAAARILLKLKGGHSDVGCRQGLNKL